MPGAVQSNELAEREEHCSLGAGEAALTQGCVKTGSFSSRSWGVTVVFQLHGGSCSGLQSYVSSLKLTFRFHGETVAMLLHPECPCDQRAPIGK